MEAISNEEYRKAILIIETFKSQQKIPAPLDEPNYQALRLATEKYIHLLKKGVISNDDFKEEIFIAAIESVFGDQVWTWIKDKLKINRK